MLKSEQFSTEMAWLARERSPAPISCACRRCACRCPLGVTLRGQPVLWVEIGPDDEAFTATLTPAGDIAMHEGDLKIAPEMGDGDAAAAVGGALAAEVPQQGHRRPAGGRRAG
jgi:hypothetical protein